MAILRLFTLITLAVLALLGCGGSNSTVAESWGGAINLRVEWPESTRLIPAATRSLKVAIFRGQTLVREVIVPRPADETETNALMGQLPATTLRLEITARPNQDGTGTPLAQATTTVRTKNDETVEVGVTLASTITEISLEPQSVVGNRGDRVGVRASAFDAQGRLVVVADSAWSWRIQNLAVALVEPFGQSCIVEIVSEVDGETVLTCKDLESGKEVSATVKPQADLGFSILEVDAGQTCPEGYSRRLAFRGRTGPPPFGTIVGVDPDLVQWETDNPSVLSVQPDGFVFGESVGTARVRVRAGSIVSEPMEVQVTANDQFQVHRWINLNPQFPNAEMQMEFQQSGVGGVFQTYVRSLPLGERSPWFAPGGFVVASARARVNGQVVGTSDGELTSGAYQTIVMIQDYSPGNSKQNILGVGGPPGSNPSFMGLVIVLNTPAKAPHNLSIVDSQDESRLLPNIGPGAVTGRGSGGTTVTSFDFPSGRMVFVLREGPNYFSAPGDLYRSQPIPFQGGKNSLVLIYHQDGQFTTKVLPLTPYD